MPYSIVKVRSALFTILLLTLLNIKVVAKPDSSSSIVSHFLVKDEYGKTMDVAAQKGKVIFINFWALTCIPCKTEMPTINRLHNHFKADTNVLILTIDLDNTLPISTQYMKDKGFDLHVYRSASVVPEALFHGELPTTVIIDKQGEIVLFKEGEDDYGSKKFFDYIDKLSAP